jgi:hypothetical protein
MEIEMENMCEVNSTYSANVNISKVLVKNVSELHPTSIINV